MQYAHLKEDSEGGDELQLTEEHHENDDDDEEAQRQNGSSSRRKNGTPSADLKQPLAPSEMDSEDPFYVFREDLFRKLDLVEESLTEYLRIVQQTDTAVNTHALKDAKKQLKRHMKHAESTLQDVKMTVTLVESQPEKFSHISSSELYERRSLVTTSQERLARTKQEMNSPAVKQKMLNDERNKVMRRAAAHQADSAAASEGEKENTAFLADSAARTSLLMHQQDETLDELDEAVTRVGHMAENIHDEIGLQNQMLEEMDDDLQDAEEKLGLVMGKLAKMLKTKDKCQLGTILMLIAVMVVLLFLVMYT